MEKLCGGEEMKRVFAMAAAALLAAACIFPTEAAAVSARKAIVMDAATGRVLYEREAESRSLIASTTKIMTALIVCERCNVLDRMRIPEEAVGIEGSSMYLQTGEILTIQDLLYGMMLRSGNDAATALAIYCGGTVEGFAELMNDKARELGLDGTHFANPHGLDAPNHYSTAKDLAVLAAYAMENPIFAMTVGTKTVKAGSRYLANHNKLLWRLEGANGVKTGYTRAAGRILVSGANRQGRQLICVTIDAQDDWNDHIQLLEQGFSRFQIVELICARQVLGQVEVLGGTEDQVFLEAAENFVYPIAEGENVTVALPDAGFVYAPVSAGEDAGVAHILIDGKAVGKVKLVYTTTVEQKENVKTNFWQRLFCR